MALAEVTKNINLLPPELQFGLLKRIILYQQTHTKRFILYVSGCMICIGLGISLLHTAFINIYQRKTSRMEQDIRQLQARHKEATGIVNQLSQAGQYLTFQIELLNRRQSFLRTQRDFGHHWALTLKELKRLVPTGVWLIGIKTEDDHLKILGGALDEKLVGDFMAELRKSPAFSNVTFNYTQNSKVGKTKVILFELTCNYDLGFIQKI